MSSPYLHYLRRRLRRLLQNQKSPRHGDQTRRLQQKDQNRLGEVTSAPGPAAKGVTSAEAGDAFMTTMRRIAIVVIADEKKRRRKMTASLFIVLIVFCIAIGYGLGTNANTLGTVVWFTFAAIIALQISYLVTIFSEW